MGSCEDLFLLRLLLLVLLLLQLCLPEGIRDVAAAWGRPGERHRRSHNVWGMGPPPRPARSLKFLAADARAIASLIRRFQVNIHRSIRRSEIRCYVRRGYNKKRRNRAVLLARV